MRNRSHPIPVSTGAVAFCLAACLAASADDRALVEMEPARAVQEALAPVLPGPPGSLGLEITYPEEDAIFSDDPSTLLWGRLEAFGVVGRVDAMIVIDTSGSTTRSAVRRDRVRERMRGRGRAEPVPSILTQEVRSAVALLENIDPGKAHLGIVSFSGSPEGVEVDRRQSARIEVPLTRRLESLDAGLQQIARRGAAGRTDMAAGLDLAVAELTGRGRSRPHPEAAKAVIFFTDGTPTLPFEDTSDNEAAVAEAAERAAAAGVRVFSFAIGPEALRRPKAAVAMARLTRGIYTPVRDPRQLAKAVKATVELEKIGKLVVRNVSLEASAHDVRVDEGGVLSGVVPLVPGRNRIFVRVVSGKIEASAERWVHYAPGSARIWNGPDRSMLAVPNLPSRKELEVTTVNQQRRELEIRLADQRKEIEVRLGNSPPASPAGLR